MTIQDQVKQKLYQYFRVMHGSANVDRDGVVHCTGDVKSRGPFPHGELPVQFHVVRDLDISATGLRTLRGCPLIVTGNFRAATNNLQDLQGGPRIVSDEYDVSACGLRSLEGAPAQVRTLKVGGNMLTSLEGLEQTKVNNVSARNNPIQTLEHIPSQASFVGFSYRPDLPVLRAVVQSQPPEIVFYDPQPPAPVKEIMERYQGRGWNWVVPCARELIRAGFKGNARL